MSDRTSEYRVHTYTAAEAGLFVNSYVVETAEGVVLVDANLLLSDIRALAARIAALHKPLMGVFVTHAHPDHFNGLPVHAGNGVPVYAAAEVAFHGTHPYTAGEVTGDAGAAQIEVVPA